MEFALGYLLGSGASIWEILIVLGVGAGISIVLYNVFGIQ